MAVPTLGDTYCSLDVLEKTLNQEAMTYQSMEDLIEVALIDSHVISAKIEEKEDYVRPFNASTAYTHR